MDFSSTFFNLGIPGQRPSGPSPYSILNLGSSLSCYKRLIHVNSNRVCPCFGVNSALVCTGMIMSCTIYLQIIYRSVIGHITMDWDCTFSFVLPVSFNMHKGNIWEIPPVWSPCKEGACVTLVHFCKFRSQKRILNSQTLPNMDPSGQVNIGSLVSIGALLIQPFYSSWDVLKHIEIWTNKEEKKLEQGHLLMFSLTFCNMTFNSHPIFDIPTVPTSLRFLRDSRPFFGFQVKSQHVREHGDLRLQ